MINFEKQLQETKLFKQGGSCWECCEYEEILKDITKTITSLLHQQEEADNKRFLEMIGEDEKQTGEPFDAYNDLCTRNRNELRQELREELKK